MDGLRIGEALLGSIEARTKLLYGIRAPEGSQINSLGAAAETPNCLVGANPDLPPR